MNVFAVTSVMLLVIATSSAYVTGNGYKILTKHSSQYFGNGANSIDSYQPLGVGAGYSEAGLVGPQDGAGWFEF
uniref:Uncharacterized protein n=1 Tax=Anopheles stephensi TaxID=30069 RepID=A0A182Y846_ANOST